MQWHRLVPLGLGVNLSCPVSRLHLLLSIPSSVMQAPGDFGDGKDNAPLNALENGCTPEDLCKSPNPAMEDPASLLKSAMIRDAMHCIALRRSLSRLMKQVLAQVTCDLTHADADDGTSNGDYLADQRWTALRRVGEAAGWLIDPVEVSLGLGLIECLAPCPLQLHLVCMPEKLLRTTIKRRTCTIA